MNSYRVRSLRRARADPATLIPRLHRIPLIQQFLFDKIGGGAISDGEPRSERLVMSGYLLLSP